MTTEQIAADIERGIIVKAEIERLKGELKIIEKRLESAALSAPHVPLAAADREGKQAELASDRHILPVRLESDMLVSFIERGSPIDNKLIDLINPVTHAALFKPVHGFERRTADGNKFRGLVRMAIDDESTALEVIDVLRSRDKDGVPKSRTVIAWDDVIKVASAK
jgi:hypothetical protein